VPRLPVVAAKSRLQQPVSVGMSVSQCGDSEMLGCTCMSSLPYAGIHFLKPGDANTYFC
jgi:hypothetical protein